MRTEYDDVIRAWLDGAEVENSHPDISEGEWYPFNCEWYLNKDSLWQYRIAEPAKEPRYLWAYLNHENGKTEFVHHKCTLFDNRYSYLGKIRLEE
jgi:hypothetical protein